MWKTTCFMNNGFGKHFIFQFSFSWWSWWSWCSWWPWCSWIGRMYSKSIVFDENVLKNDFVYLVLSLFMMVVMVMMSGSGRCRGRWKKSNEGKTETFSRNVCLKTDYIFSFFCCKISFMEIHVFGSKTRSDCSWTIILDIFIKNCIR